MRSANFIEKEVRNAKNVCGNKQQILNFHNHAYIIIVIASMAHFPPADELHSPLFASQKFSWEALTEIIKEQRFDSLRRSIKQQRFYCNYSHTLKLNWKSIYDFILHSKFNYEMIAVPETAEMFHSTFVEYDEADCEGDISLLPNIPPPPPGNKWEARRPTDESNMKNRALAKNDFPYYLEDGVEHWCLWKLGDDVTNEDIDCGMDELKGRGIYAEILHWINPVHLKSLPDIDHAHFVCLRK